MMTLASRIYTWPTRRPIWTLFISACICLVAFLLVRQLRIDSSLEPLFAHGDPTSAALVHVLNDFSALDDLIVLVSLPSQDEKSDKNIEETSSKRADATRLIEYAQRMKKEISSSTQVSSMISSMSYRIGDEAQRFIQEVVAPSGIYYLDDANFETLKTRLSTQGIREQIQRDESLIATPSPAAGAIAKNIIRDPLRLHELLTQSLLRMRPRGAANSGSDAFLSADGRSLLIRISGSRPASDIEFTKQFMNQVRSIAASANPGELQVEFTGGYAMTEVGERTIRRDMMLSVFGSIVMLQTLFLLTYPSLLFSLLVLTPVAIGTLLGFGFFALISSKLTPVGGGIGSILAGVGVDYGILYLAHFNRRRAAGCTAIEASDLSHGIGLDLALACLTSLAAFVAIGASETPALRDFAMLGGLGVAGAFIATLTILPAFLAIITRFTRTKTTPRPRVRFDVLVKSIAFRPREYLTAGLVLGVLPAVVMLIVCWPRDSAFEQDLTVMHPRPNEPLLVQETINQTFPGVMGSLAIHLHANTPEQLVTLAMQVDERLNTNEIHQLGVMQTFSIATLLPSMEMVQHRRAQIKELDADRIVSDLRNALNESSFDPASFEEYIKFLHQSIESSPVPQLETLTHFPRIAGNFLPKSAFVAGGSAPTQAMTLALLQAPFENAHQRDATLDVIRKSIADLPGATLTGLSVVNHDIEASVRSDLPRVMMLATGLVIFFLVIGIRRPVPALLAMIPPLVGVIFLLAVMAVAGVRFNLVNLVALPLLAGIGVDYGIFLVGISARHKRDSALDHISAFEEYTASTYAVVMCAATAFLGFGSLVFTHTPAMRSLGLLLGASIIGTLVGTFFILLPILCVEHPFLLQQSSSTNARLSENQK